MKDATTNADVKMTAQNGHSAQNGKNGEEMGILSGKIVRRCLIAW